MTEFILLGQESSGNHAIASLFSRLTCDGKQILGTDMCGWLDHRFKYHDQEAFESVWLGKRKLIDFEYTHLVTSRSVPCGGRVPDLDGFVAQCKNPKIVVITRDQNVVAKSASKIRGRKTATQSYLMLRELIKKYEPAFFSYEALVSFSKAYMTSWLRHHAPEFTLDDVWYDFIADGNKKYF